MTLTLQGSNSAASTSVTIPTHAVGDIIVIFAYRGNSATIPTKPTAGGTVPDWVDIDAVNGANTNSSRTAYFVATANDHTSGTWTNASGMVATVLRGQMATTPIGGHTESGSTASGSATAPAITLSVSDGTSAILEFYGHRTVTAWDSAPTGYTNQTSVATEVCFNTKDDTTSDGSIAQTCTSTSSGYRGATIEILMDPLPTSYDEDIDRVDTPVPTWAKGCYVTMIGGGGGGGAADVRATSGKGGGGGGGGGLVKRVWVPVGELGSTFSVIRGTGGPGGATQGTDGTNGNNSVFTTGSVTITASGGVKGNHGGNSGTGGSGGGTSIGSLTVEYTETGATGGQGAQSGTTGSPGGDSTDAGAGGGGGGANFTNQYNGGDGGDSSTVSGGAGGVGTSDPGDTPSDAATGEGGAGGGGGASGYGFGSVGGTGGNGGGEGAGGGGGGGKEGGSGSGGVGGSGADGYTLVEWIIGDDLFFPFISKGVGR